MGASNKSSGHILKYMVVIELILSAQRIQILRSFTHSYSYFGKAKNKNYARSCCYCVSCASSFAIQILCVFFLFFNLILKYLFYFRVRTYSEFIQIHHSVSLSSLLSSSFSLRLDRARLFVRYFVPFALSWLSILTVKSNNTNPFTLWMDGGSEQRENAGYKLLVALNHRLLMLTKRARALDPM